MQTIAVDVLVCGGGMSGMAFASFAAQSGGKVLVAEKQPHVGGSSAYSAGMFWGPKTYESLRGWVPDGDAELQKAWMRDYLPAVQWMRENGVPTSEQFGPIMSIGIGYPIKIPDLYQVHAKQIADSNTGSRVLTNTKVVKILQEVPGVAGSPVIGAILQKISPDGKPSELIEVKAKLVVMATGGFQGSPGLRAKFLGPAGDNLFVRSNKGSVGDGLTLASSAGASTSRGMATYYGHLMASPLRVEDVSPEEYLPLAQYQSRRCILINERGQRFADETLGDEIVNQYLTKQENRRGFILFSEATRAKYCTAAIFPNGGNVDRLKKAREYGCRVAESPTLAGLIEIIAGWGVDATGTKRTLDEYYRSVQLGDREVCLDHTVGRGGEPPVALKEGDGPYFAMEVQPSITFTYGGISIDSRGRALTHDKTPIPGLLIAGVDAGGFSNMGYAGGLALAFVTGYWAAREAARELGLPLPQLPAAAVEDLDSIKPSQASSRL